MDNFDRFFIAFIMILLFVLILIQGFQIRSLGKKVKALETTSTELRR